MPEYYKKDLSIELLREYFDYEPESGNLIWKKKPSAKVYAGSIAGIKKTFWSGKSYIYIQFCKKKIMAHKVIFAIVEGYIPDCVDHIDGDGTNNKWSNIRSIEYSENGKNMKIGKANKTGVMGVHKKGEKFIATIRADGRRIYLGSFEDLNLAAKARKHAENKYGFHELHGTSR